MAWRTLSPPIPQQWCGSVCVVHIAHQCVKLPKPLSVLFVLSKWFLAQFSWPLFQSLDVFHALSRTVIVCVCVCLREFVGICIGLACVLPMQRICAHWDCMPFEYQTQRKRVWERKKAIHLYRIQGRLPILPMFLIWCNFSIDVIVHP